MNLVYPPQGSSNTTLPLVSLTVPMEAVRGLRFDSGQWLIYVSDPEHMAVAKFRLSKEVLKGAAEHFYRDFPPIRPLNADQGEELLRWLLTEKSLRVEMIGTDGLPSMFPRIPRIGGSPGLGMQGPEVTR